MPLVILFVASTISGCIGAGLPFGPDKDPVGATTFQDGGSNTTAWVLEVVGHFHVPHGTRFTLETNTTACTTTGWSEKTANATLACQTDDGSGRSAPYDITHRDLDGDGRATRGDRLEVRPTDGAATLDGPHRLVLALHPELPLFVLEQEFGPEGPMGPLAVELLG